jgi:hypothetical protein
VLSLLLDSHVQVRVQQDVQRDVSAARELAGDNWNKRQERHATVWAVSRSVARLRADQSRPIERAFERCGLWNPLNGSLNHRVSIVQFDNGPSLFNYDTFMKDYRASQAKAPHRHDFTPGGIASVQRNERTEQFLACVVFCVFI